MRLSYTLGAPIVQTDLKSGGGRSYTGSAADDSPDIETLYNYCFRFVTFCAIFKSERLEYKWRRKTGQNFALFDPPVKNRGGLVEMYVRIIRVT